jgi:hypothetical protein
MIVSNIRARVAQPNTPESDKMEFVFHVVQCEIDGMKYQMQVNARCPMDAIKWLRQHLHNCEKYKLYDRGREIS